MAYRHSMNKDVGLYIKPGMNIQLMSWVKDI